VLTEYLSWRWCLYVNLLIAIPAALAALALLHNEVPAIKPKLDIPGTITASTGLFAIVYGFSNAQTHSWSAPLTVGMLIAGVALLSAFVAIQQRSAHPLLPLRVVLDRDRGGSFLAMVLAGSGMFAVFLFLTFYLQQNLGFSPIKTGLAFLPMTGTIIIAATAGSTTLLPKIGPRPLIGTGMIISAAGLVTLTSVGVDTAYATHVLPGLLIMGAGMGLVFSSAMATATFGVEPKDAGVASAMVNTMQQVGGSIGTALLSTIAASATTSDLAGHVPNAAVLSHAAVHGYTTAFWWAAAIFATGAVLCTALLSSRSRAVAAPATEPAFAHS
jgi:predicted MFS family arabinose efflux permease